MELRIQNEPVPIRYTERLDAAVPGDLRRAAAILRDGGTVAFPTETVYGLGANALEAGAVARIFAAKQRPSWDPLIVHVADREQLPEITSAPLDHPALRRLMDAFWPGPLTLLLPKLAVVPDAVTAGRPLVGVRIPAHPVARELLRLTGLPVAAPSANRFGHTSPTTAAHVLADLDGRIDAVLDGGAAAVGVESTVAEMSFSAAGEPGDIPGVTIYRPGAVTAAMLEQVLGAGARVRLYEPEPGVAGVVPESLPSPGVGIRHYAPRARVVLVPTLAGPLLERTLLEPSLLAACEQSGFREGKLGLLLPEGWLAPPGAVSFHWGAWSDLEELARNLFAGLRGLDDLGVTTIVVPLPPAEGLGAELVDRLRKAAKVEGEIG